MRALFFSPTLIKTSFLSKATILPDSIRSHSLNSFRPPPRSTSDIPMAAAVVKSTSSIDEGLARKLWVKFRREAIFATYNPFTVCLASGNLRIETFRQYIAQDAVFLKAFYQAYELAEECADDDDATISISELKKNVAEELKLHSSVAQEWGLDIAKECTINLATVKYTDFLLATASGKVEGVKAPGKLATPFEKTKVAAYTLGAMTPCMRLYAYLGIEFKALLDPKEASNHPYKKWIDNYSCDEFQAAALQTEDLLDKLSVTMTGEELDVVEKLYHQAMKLEIDFFNAQQLTQPTVLPLIKKHSPEEDHLIIFSDFDLTCTILDSSAILAELAIVTAPKTDQNQPENKIARLASGELRNTWTRLSKQYTEEYEECIERILLSQKVDQFNHDALSKSLEILSEFEKKANSRVVESGVLKGINIEDIKRAGGRVILQDGCIDFFQKIRTNKNLNASVQILSYCWCGDLIRAAFSSGGLDAIDVHANEFSLEESISTGKIERKVESPIDKVQAFKDILRNNSDKKNMTLYIGDSIGDLLCLLEADIGIVIGSSSSLRRLGEHFGISFVPLFAGLVKKQNEYMEEDSCNWKGLSGTLYTVSSWAEIHAFVLGW